jgi:retinol dehydrogenase-12
MTNSNQQLMRGKTCLVSGATAGIGKITATALAGMGAELVIHGRNQAKAEDVVREIQSTTGNKKVSYLLADFTDLDQVREMASTFLSTYPQLDLLVNNAGAFFNKRISTPYGVEMTFLVNHLAPFLLTNLLLDVLKSSAPARIITVSSEGHRQDKMDFNDLGFEKGYFGMKAYARSKLANILFTIELAKRLEGSKVTANALHPGHIATDIWKTNFGILGPVLKWFMSRIALSPEEGAQNSIYLASSPEVSEISGKYFIKDETAPSSPLSSDPALARQLWEISENLTGLKAN